MTTRQEIAAELARKKRGVSTITSEDVANGAAPPVPTYQVPMSGGQTERAEPGAAIPVPQEKEYRAPVLWAGGLPVPKESGIRDVLNVASGGGTEAVNAAVQGADAQAAGEVEGKGLVRKPMSPEERALLAQQADPEGAARGVLVRTPAGWQPGTRTNAEGTTGKDPNAVRAAMGLQGQAESSDLKQMGGQQAADRTQYELLQKVQQNEFKANQEFKKDADALDARYQQERQVQLEKMQSIQKAMDAVPNAPRTIREKLDASGTTTKIGLGLAAAFSVLGGASLKDGGASAQTFLKTVQANIDRGVQKEADEYARLGKRAEMSTNIYGHLRESMKDDQAAQNITKALYYQAAANTVEQIATQYKMDSQSPQVQGLISHLLRERQKLIMDTASTVQDQVSQTDKYNPGGLVQVGGANRNGKPGPWEEVIGKYGQEFDKRGGNSATRAIALYQKAQQEMREGGFANDEKFLSVFAAMNSADSPAAQAAILTDANLNPKQRAALQHVIEAGSEQLKDESGKSVTANELARDIMKKGGYSILSLDTVRDNLAKKRENIYTSVDGTFGGPGNVVGHAYRARVALSEDERLNPGIGTSEPQAIDPADMRRQVRGSLQ